MILLEWRPTFLWRLVLYQPASRKQFAPAHYVRHRRSAPKSWSLHGAEPAGYQPCVRLRYARSQGERMGEGCLRRGVSDWLDRLARSTRDLLNTLAAIADRKAGFRSLGDAWTDTTTAHGRLMLTVLGRLAEFERDLICARTGEGRARAAARGQKMGRPFNLTDHQKPDDQAPKPRRDACQIARSYNVSPAMISRPTL